MHRRLLTKNLYKKLPETPGVYIFWQNKTPIYIGKAKNLKSRVSSYFSTNLGPKTSRMISDSNYFSYIKVISELESLLLESTLIRKFKPKFNSASKDDKHPLYIEITKEKFPRVITSRKSDQVSFGPFPSATNVRLVLRMLRRVFPYADHKISKRPCLYSHMGLCNPCPSTIENIKDTKKKQNLMRVYKRNVRFIKAVLSGKSDQVRKILVSEMNAFSKNELFEEAASVREQIRKLDYITQPIIPPENFLENPNFETDVRLQEMQMIKNILSPFITFNKIFSRVECFDISHISGSFSTASMVTFIDGEKDTSFYRHFKIRQTKGSSDFDSMKEVAKRRIKNLEAWGRPDLIIVDGGRAQVSAFSVSLKKLSIPVVGLAKGEEKLVVPVHDRGARAYKEIKPVGPALRLVTRIRDEAHRFARRYHYKLVKNSLIPRTVDNT